MPETQANHQVTSTTETTSYFDDEDLLIREEQELPEIPSWPSLLKPPTN